MLYSEIIAVCSQIHIKHINTLCGQNVGLLNVKLVAYKGASNSGTDSIWMERPRTTAEGLSEKPVCRALLQSVPKWKRSRETNIRNLRIATADRIHTARQLRPQNKRQNVFALLTFSCQWTVHSTFARNVPPAWLRAHQVLLSNISYLASVLLPAQEAALDFNVFHENRPTEASRKNIL
jgi:hypothetical protein